MVLREIAASLGIARYPASMDGIFSELSATDAPACDIALIDSLQQEFDLFAEFYPQVRELAHAVNADPGLNLWVRTAVAYAQPRPVVRTRVIPVPKMDGSAVRAMLPLYILIALVPDGVAEYRRRGFSEQEIRHILAAFPAGLRVVQFHAGLPGLNSLYYGWLALFAKARIFYAGGYQFELRSLPGEAVYLKHKHTHQTVALLCQGQVLPTGELFANVADGPEEVAFSVSFTESDTCYCGYPILHGKVSCEPVAYPKSEWVCAARPEDACLSIHIPTGTDMSPAAVDNALKEGARLARERYPEHAFVCVYCGSWLLNPHLTEMLGPRSKVAMFGGRFARYPQISDGAAAMGYVFPGAGSDLASLPENTTLQREAKAFLLAGGRIRNYGGAIL